MYKLILFDVDGVFLSEERCFDASALSVWELLYAPSNLGLTSDHFETKVDEEKIQEIRMTIFQNDSILSYMKTRGVNANWDMIYLSISAQILLLLRRINRHDPHFVQTFLSQPIVEESLSQLRAQLNKHKITHVDFAETTTVFANTKAKTPSEMFRDLNQQVKSWFSISGTLFGRKTPLWMLGYHTFQSWYLGDDLYRETEAREAKIPGKRGFLADEVPIISSADISQLLTRLEQNGIVAGIGTGRSRLETETPFKQLDIWDCFDENRIVTASDVIQAEHTFPEHAPLAKPNPYSYVRAFLGQSTSISDCLEQSLPLENGEEILIVGDSVADYLAAREMGSRFAATLTGLTGKDARTTFENLGADYILDDVSQLAQALGLPETS
ncbi:HAD family hydrolase [Hazenella sp. IB182353]|uniref:HAD family hydrolase n=1 Tax=Polycladospora coralii TaxID=2771432 RepID=UPI0017472198|nr:HAD family hydrolase [Polycladospora coralii]MBS7531711.1 HAD family hydrolase [Polycladospora coralii]